MKKKFAIFSLFAILLGLGFVTTSAAEAGYYGNTATCALPGAAYNGWNGYGSGYGCGGVGIIPGYGWGNGYNGYGYAPSYSNWYNYNGYGGWNGYGFPNRGSYYNGLPTYPSYYGNYYGNGFGTGGCYYTSYGAYVCG